MAAACEQFVSSSIVDPQLRRVHRRLVGVLLAAPFLGGGAAVALSTANVGAAATMAVILALFGLGWLAAMMVSVTANAALVGVPALLAGGCGLAALLAAGGGLASPVALLCLALPLETFWVSSSRRAATCAAAIALAAVILYPTLGAIIPAYGQPAAWHWLIPLAWAATLVGRFGQFSGNPTNRGEGIEERLEEVIDAVVFRIGHGGEVLEASAKAAAILDVAPVLWLGTGLFDRIHISDRVTYLSALADLRDGAPQRRLELRLRLPNQTGSFGDNYRSLVVDLIRSGSGRPFYAIVREQGDVAELRAALAAARENAAGADVAKSRFLAAVSHELRTPLNVILGFSDMLLYEMFGPFADPRQKEYVSLIRQSGQHLLDVVTSILDISRLESGTYTVLPEPFRFADAVAICHSMMSLPARQKDIALTTQVAADVGEITADRRAIQQILINLAANAIKFTPEGGSVSIGARRVGSRLHFWVSDDGIGIAEADLHNLGKPFTQVHNDYTRRYEGTGLGLSLVKGLVALHEGAMAIESAPGEGTKVTISLPVEGPKGKQDESVIVPMPKARDAKEIHNGALRQTA